MALWDEENAGYDSYTPDDYGGTLDISYNNALTKQQAYEQQAANQAEADAISANPTYGYGDAGNPSGAGAAGTSYDFTKGSSGLKPFKQAYQRQKR